MPEIGKPFDEQKAVHMSGVILFELIDAPVRARPPEPSASMPPGSEVHPEESVADATVRSGEATVES